MNRQIALAAIALAAGLMFGCSSSSNGYMSPTASGSGGTCGAATPVSLTVKNFLKWCSVSVAGVTASSEAAQTTCVAAGTVALSATANTGFELGTMPWQHTSGDHGSGDPGTVTGTGQSAASATTVTVSGSSACVSVCCPGVNGSAACPTTNQCP